jgi:DNA-binding NtrC family response regulator
MTLEELEREYILKVLNHTRWHKKRASEILGINASTLYRKLQAYQMEGKVSGERAADVERMRPDADGGEEEREAA